MQKYYVISCHVLWRDLCYFASLSQNVFNFQFLKQGLHSTPKLLRRQLQDAIDAIDAADEEYAAILIGYGLCSNGLAGIKARNTKLVMMRGHDCITFFLGSKERYQAYFDQNPGTYWYSPGWIDTTSMPGRERYEKTMQTYIEKYGEENAEYLMQMTQQWYNEYSNATYVDLGYSDTTKYKEFTKQCARELQWNYDELSGDSQLMVDFLEGNWDSENYLIVEPGQTVAPSYDRQIIQIEEIDVMTAVEVAG